ncbi:hypothetical protein [Cohnella sp. WQ 127256]|uniref:hypothetical protein n=1 Tax=Cohnella sp. WQ 127256 TaxID=2938790 RepID=UPI002118457D|nr:hypothetical protein [Cohnella sp. WQ 127256]
MKETKPDWYGIAKGGLDDASFNEQMKQEVTRRTQESQPIQRKFKKWAGWATAIVLCVVLLFLVMPTPSNDQPVIPAGTLTPIPNDIPTPLPTPTETIQPPETTMPIAEEQIKLSYEDPEGSLATLGVYPAEVNRIEATQIDKSSIIVKRVVEVDELGKYVIYIKKEDETQLYAGLEIPTDGPNSGSTNKIYEIGTAGELTYLNEIAITKSYLFGEFHLRIYGVCGANCVTNNWIHFEEALPGVPISDFRLETHAQEVDIDEDGTPEVIATVASTIGRVLIYKKVDSEIKFVDLNIVLKAELPNTVLYDNNSRIFKAIYEDNRIFSYQYKKGEDTLILVNDSQVEIDQDQLFIGMDYDGTSSIKLQVEGTLVPAEWFKDPFRDFGLYLPDSIKTVKFEDGYEYESKKGSGIIQLMEADESSLPYLRKEKDLISYSEYLGTEFWGDNQNIRYDYFQYETEQNNRTYISIRYNTADMEHLRPLLLAVIANVRYAKDN